MAERRQLPGGDDPDEIRANLLKIGDDPAHDAWARWGHLIHYVNGRSTMIGIQKLTAMVQAIVRSAAERADDRGATAVEYGLIVALIAAIIVGVVTTVGTDVQNAFQIVANALPTP